MKNEEILNLKIDSPEFDSNTTIRDYLKLLLVKLLKEGECFSSKRPFGNSNHEYTLYKPLINSGLVSGKIDEDGYIDEVDEGAADKLLIKLVESL